jgi:predicted nucleic acid-binding protein
VADGPLVVNASPLIVLAKVGHLSLLEALATDVFVPEPVAIEVLAGEPGDPARTALATGFGSRLAITEIPATVIEWSLGAGESSVIAACLARPGSTAVLDDAEARACARTLSVPMIGTLGIVVRARLRSLGEDP